MYQLRGLSFCELREAAAAALLCFYQLNSVYLVCNICGTLLVGCLCWQLGFGYGQVGDFKNFKTP
jgi:hypothetical protein